MLDELHVSIEVPEETDEAAAIELGAMIGQSLRDWAHDLATQLSAEGQAVVIKVWE